MLKGMASACLVGRWTDTLYSPGAASDEILNIRGDGTGRLDIWKWRLCEVIYFTWTADDGALTVDGERYFLLDDEERTVQEHPWSWNWKAVPYSVEVSAAPLHPDGVEVLTIDHQTAGLDNRFGRISSDVPSDMGKYKDRWRHNDRSHDSGPRLRSSLAKRVVAGRTGQRPITIRSLRWSSQRERSAALRGCDAISVCWGKPRVTGLYA